MSIKLNLTTGLTCALMLGNVAIAASNDPKVWFSLTDGTGDPSDVCLTRAKKLAEQMESGSAEIEKQRHKENLGPNDIHPREHISVTYLLPNDQTARIYLTCQYGQPVTMSETQSGETCAEVNMLNFPETKIPGVQDAFSIRLGDYKGYGGKAGIELFDRMVEQYRNDYNPVQAALTGGCSEIE